MAGRGLLTAQPSPPPHPGSHTQRHEGGEKRENGKREEERTDFANQSHARVPPGMARLLRGVTRHPCTTVQACFVRATLPKTLQPPRSACTGKVIYGWCSGCKQLLGTRGDRPILHLPQQGGDLPEGEIRWLLHLLILIPHPCTSPDGWEKLGNAWRDVGLMEKKAHGGRVGQL